MRRVSRRFGFKEVAEDDDWNLFWTDYSVNLERVMDMKKYQVKYSGVQKCSLQLINISKHGSKFVVAMVANATMFSHLLPGCSCGSKHLLLP